MALATDPTAYRSLMPTASVSQYQSDVLGGPTGGQPLPRSVMQSTVPKVAYPAKTGSGLAPASLVYTGTRQLQDRRPKQTAQPTVTPRSGGASPLTTGGSGSNSDRGGVYGLTSKAGGRLQALQKAYQAQFGQALTVNSGGRSRHDQEIAYRNYLNGGNLAAKPGTSVHEFGKAVDFGGAANHYSPQHTWLVNNGPKFGWVWAGKNFSQVEPWHFEFRG